MENVTDLVNGLPLGTAHDAEQPHLLPESTLHANTASSTTASAHPTHIPSPGTLTNGLTMLTDPAVARFTEITPDTAAKLALASWHAEQLEPISNGLVVPGSQDLQQLLTSTRILANIFINTAALLNLLINRANPALLTKDPAHSFSASLEKSFKKYSSSSPSPHLRLYDVGTVKTWGG
ncbi:hypothetical protein PENSPDRAFT_695720 [Peniophora sp. CONT]|nr:hypothetical protein PENSPDRAFT_695720 [Peniophora sp. CONT]